MANRRLTSTARFPSYAQGCLHVRTILILFLLPALAARAQHLPPAAQSLPPAAPTTMPAPTLPPPTQVTVPAPGPDRPEQLAARRARIAFNGQVLQITAENSSLNQILREVSRVTGMRISGGVTEERVYGIYGPAEPSAVLTLLLAGTGSNMLLMVDDRQKPVELVLTPRTGGVTPPSPNAQGHDQPDDEDPDIPPQLARHPPRERVPPPVPQSPTPVAQPAPAAPAQPSPASPAATTTTDQSPNGVKTPQQIYDQLLKLQQQQPK